MENAIFGAETGDIAETRKAMRRKNWKKRMAFLLAAAMTVGAVPQTGMQGQAATDTTQELSLIHI